MKPTIEVPDSLGKRLNDYLKEHPEETLFSLVQEAKVDLTDLKAMLRQLLSNFVTFVPLW